MMVEAILESSQDFGASGASLPQWKRELLQRRLARSRPCAAPAPPPPPPPPPAADDDEELRYGPGIVKRLKSRYLSLALRDAPRRRPSLLRRAASLEHLLDEHLLDERPPPAPRARASRPAPPAARAPAPRREAVKRARSVDALSGLEPRDEPEPRAPRPPRRPQPLLREAERPPPDVVRSTLRKFESAPPRRPAPAARVSAALRGLEPRRSASPEPECPQPESPPPASPPPAAPAPDPSPVAAAAPTALRDSPQRAISSSPPPPASPSRATPVAEPPRSPAPAIPEGAPPSPPRSPVATAAPAPSVPRIGPSPARAGRAESPSADEVEGCAARLVSRAALERIARAGSSVRYAFASPRAGEHAPPLAATNPVLAARGLRRVGVIRPMPASPAPAPLVNGHSTPEPSSLSRIGAAGIERAWSGSAVDEIAAPDRKPCWLRAGGPRPRAPAVAATSVVFNFSDRKEVPDYIENDGIILRASRRNRIKAGEPGVVVLRPEALTVDTELDAQELEAEAGPPSPCDVRFVNDNVLINGKSSMPGKPNKDRIAKLKLQFDDSLTRTFEYPSETSMCEDVPSPAPPAPPAPHDNSASLADNTHIASAALSRYTPSKTCAAAFHLGLASPHPADLPLDRRVGVGAAEEGAEGAEGAGEGEGDARPCGADAAKSWSDARAQHTDLLF